MNRAEFMERLQELLEEIPQAEREDALQYYNDYLDDAGAENENAALAALGSPESVAESIRAGLQEEEDFGEFTEGGFRLGEEEIREPVPVSGRGRAEDRENGEDRAKAAQRTERTDFRNGARSYAGYGPDPRGETASGNGPAPHGPNPYGPGRYGPNPYGTGQRRPKKRGAGEIFLLILAGIFLIPILVPVGLGAVIVAFVFLVCVMIFYACLVCGGISLLAAGVVLIVFAAANLAVAPASAVCILGGGLAGTGIGLLLTLLSVWLAVRTVPAMCRGFVNLCSLPFHRRQAAG
ncbi:MAG TPA: hypothetical protein H9700_00370 [Candidatus Eisenbergiella intestinipullorum]|nr:hypothetical protein [Candidatus Eisenbergiella intestinipullorum]